MNRTLRRLAVAASLATGLALAIPASGALASPAGHPAPAPHAEQFSLEVSGIGAVTVNDVEATGPVAITAGTVSELTPVRDQYTSGSDDVIVRHSPLAALTVDNAACTAYVAEHGYWRFAGGAGADLFARGSGTFDETALWSFALTPKWVKVHHHKYLKMVCPLAAQTPAQVSADTQGTGTVSASFYDVAVHGTGTARA
jgi:hypothetical protein